MKKEFINPEMEVLRLQKGADVLLTSTVTGPPIGGSGDADGHQSLSRGKFDDDDF